MKNLIKCMTLALFVFVLCMVTEGTAYAADTKEDVFCDNENGIITIKYNNKDNAKMKIGVTKDKQSYYYDLGSGSNEIDIPLTMGNGSYKIKILKNISGTKYGVVVSTNIELELKDENLVYKQSNVVIDFELTDQSIKKSDELVKNCKSDKEIVSTIYQYVIKNFVYDYDKAKTVSAGYLPDIEIVYKNKKGICYDISAIMAAMMRSQGIEVKLVTGYTPNIPGIYHAWNSIYDSEGKSWYTVDGTYDISMYRSGKKYKMKKSEKNYSNIKYEY